MNPQELSVVRGVLASAKVVSAQAPDAEVLAAHAATLSGPSGADYKSSLAAQGVQVGPSWFTIIGCVGGAVAVYFIWKHYRQEQVDAFDYPDSDSRDTRLHLRGMRGALGTLAPKRMGCAGPRRGLGRFGGPPPGVRTPGGGAGTRTAEKYEFEPEIRLEGYRRRKARRK